jgi:sugar lactone lactonase YvrE
LSGVNIFSELRIISSQIFYAQPLTVAPGTISAFDFGAKTDTIFNRCVIVKIDECEKIPDGIGIDEENMVWKVI